MERGEFSVVYQPQFDRSETQLSGVEALVRWETASGAVGPDDFIRAAEAEGVIDRITDFVLRQALTECQDGAYTVGVNVSAMEFARSDFIQRIKAALDAARSSRAGLNWRSPKPPFSNNLI